MYLPVFSLHKEMVAKRDLVDAEDEDVPPGCRRVVTSKGREIVTAGGLRLTSQVIWTS